MGPETVPAPVPPSARNVIPGGTLPPKVNDCGAAGEPVTVNTNVVGTPAVTLAGLGWDGLSAVAPAILCMAPSAPKVETAAFNTEVAGDERTVSAAVATTRTAGVRWSKAMRSVPGRFNQCSRRREAGDNFMGRNEGEKRKRCEQLRGPE